MTEQDYSELTDDEFDALVVELAEKDGAANVVTIPGVWEVVREHYNNAALELWENRRYQDAVYSSKIQG